MARRNRILEGVEATQSGVLVEGESYLAACRVERETGFFDAPIVGLVKAANRDHPPGMTIPEDMIWAATNHRLLIWTRDKVTGRKPKRLVASFPYGAELQALNVLSKKESRGAHAGKLYAHLYVRGVRIEVEAPVLDIRELGEVVQAHLLAGPHRVPPPPPTMGS